MGPNVRLVPFEERHIRDDYIGWLNDNELMRYSRQRRIHHDRDSCLEYLRSFWGTPHRFWSIERQTDGKQIGTMTAYVDRENRVADVGILVGAPDARGTGMGREAWGLALDYLFQGEGVRKVTGGTSAANAPMIRIFKHWGMLLEGTRRKQDLIDGEPCDVLLFGILREEWDRRIGTQLQP